MASNARVRIRSAGARAILASPGVAQRLGEMAAAIAASANAKASPDEMLNDPYDFDVESGGERSRASVFTASPHGIYDNNKHNTLLKSIDAGR